MGSRLKTTAMPCTNHICVSCVIIVIVVIIIVTTTKTIIVRTKVAFQLI